MNQGPPRTAFVIYSASLVYYVASHSRDASRVADRDARVSEGKSMTSPSHEYLLFLFFSSQFGEAIVSVVE
jgi:hypothetical protein